MTLLVSIALEDEFGQQVELNMVMDKYEMKMAVNYCFASGMGYMC